MNSLKRRKIQHFFNRAGFGVDKSTLDRVQGLDLQKIVKQWFNDSKDYTTQEYLATDKGWGKKAGRKRNRGLVKKQWYKKMLLDNAQLREKMVLFWHGHFACETILSKFRRQYVDTLRHHALGNFHEMVLAIAKDPAMLQYLNNQQNKKTAPNENFARELLELFTMGIGNYTEKDIKEAARAFTGWTHNGDGDFVFRKNQHDEGEKVFFGKKGNFGGEDIIRIVLEDKRTAKYITTKIYSYFVNENVDDKRVESLTNQFYRDYDIEKLMYTIFSSEWFYDEQNIGARIKSPVELMVGTIRILRAEPRNILEMRGMERSMGHILLSPPNVAGWKEGRGWLDSTRLLNRLRMPEKLLANSVYFPGTRSNLGSQIVGNYEDFIAQYNVKGSTKTALLDHLLIVDLNTPIDLKGMDEEPDHSRKLLLEILSTPEYQLC